MTTIFETNLSSPALTVAAGIAGSAGGVGALASAAQAVVGYGGVFSDQNIALSPKYNTNNRVLDTMARLFIPLPDIATRDKYLNSLSGATNNPNGQNDARRLAEVLAVGGTSFGGAQNGAGYVDFLMAQAQESYSEKVQIAEVLSDNYVAYFFGSAPPIFNYSGVLLNTLQNDWRAAFSVLYHNVMRGTQLARRKVTLCLTYDNVVVSGALLGMSQTLDAQQQMAAAFSFSMLVKQYSVYISPNSLPTNQAPASGLLASKQFSPAGFANVVSVESAKTPISILTIDSPTVSMTPGAETPVANQTNAVTDEAVTQETYRKFGVSQTNDETDEWVKNMIYPQSMPPP